MAIRFNGATEYYRRTANMPLITSFTAMGWSYIHTDRGAVTQSIFGCSTTPGSTADVFFSWDNGSNIMDIGSYVSAGAEFTNFGSRPAVGNWFHWYVRCSGTGAGLLQAGWAGVSDTAYVTASTQLDASAAMGQVMINQSGFSEYCDQSVAAFKMWEAALTDDDIANERWTYRQIRNVNLSVWMPIIDGVLGDNVDDWGGNARDFEPLGTMTVEDGPPLSFGGASTFLPLSTPLPAPALHVIHSGMRW